MIPQATKSIALASSAPRTSGDDPDEDDFNVAYFGCSPHERG